MDFRKRIKEATFKDVLILVFLILMMILVALNISTVMAVFNKVYGLLKPFVYGICIAFVFNLPMNFFMKILPKKKNNEPRKLLAALMTLFCFIVVIALIIWILVPHIVENIIMLVNNFDSYTREIQKFIEEIFVEFGLSQEMIQTFVNSLDELSNQFVKTLQSLIPALVNTVTVVANSITNIVFAFLIAIYLVISKEKLLSQVDYIGKIFLKRNHYITLKEFAHLTNDTFASFISGQGIEAVIIGVLCYIGCKILGFEYASIVSVIIGITNVIPIFGAIIGTGLGALLIAFVNPMQGFIFLIFGICLQQVESNLIYPQVVGSSVGLPPLWVLFAVTVGGGLFGVSGLLFGLPAFSVVYEILRRIVHKRENSQELIESTETTCK